MRRAAELEEYLDYGKWEPTPKVYAFFGYKPWRRRIWRCWYTPEPAGWDYANDEELARNFLEQRCADRILG